MNYWNIDYSKEIEFEIDKLSDYPDNFYAIGNDESLQHLATDININGQLKNIFIANLNGVLFILDGRRRHRAMQLLGKTHIRGLLVNLKQEDIPFFCMAANFYRQKTNYEICEEVTIIKKSIVRHQGKKITIAPIEPVTAPTNKDIKTDSNDPVRSDSANVTTGTPATNNKSQPKKTHLPPNGKGMQPFAPIRIPVGFDTESTTIEFPVEKDTTNNNPAQDDTTYSSDDSESIQGETHDEPENNITEDASLSSDSPTIEQPPVKNPSNRPPTTTQQAIDQLGYSDITSARTVERYERIMRVHKKYPGAGLKEMLENNVKIETVEKKAIELEKRNSDREDAKSVKILRLPVRKSRLNLFNKDNQDMSEIEDESLDFTMTSVPYLQQMFYGNQNEVGQEETVKRFIDSLIKSAAEVYRKSAKSASYLVNLKETRKLMVNNNIEQWFVIRMAEIGWHLRDILIWVKDGAGKLAGKRDKMPENGYEPIFWFVKDKDYYYRPVAKSIPNDPIKCTQKTVVRNEKDGTKVYDKLFLNVAFNAFGNVINDTQFLNVIKAPTAGPESQLFNKYYGSHPAPFSVSLPLLPVLMFCPKDGRYLDNYMGRGSGLVAPLLLGHTCYGYELNPKYFEMAEKLLADVQKDIEVYMERMRSVEEQFDIKYNRAA